MKVYVTSLIPPRIEFAYRSDSLLQHFAVGRHSDADAYYRGLELAECLSLVPDVPIMPYGIADSLTQAYCVDLLVSYIVHEIREVSLDLNDGLNI
jgi:hypothetical protein